MWTKAEYDHVPRELDEESSSTHVYIRKNIKAFEREKEILYTCDEQMISKSDWDVYKGLLETKSDIDDINDALIELAMMIGG